ncbi:MAG: RHS repeat protein [Bdellovibrionales bacterium]|nr:RHS repeat protein [Bdellovibrionales bacterium]
MRLNSWILLAGVCSSVYSSIPAFAGINVNNGNFYIAYTDFFVPTQGLNIEISRTYNSRSNYVKGYFGVGWASELEGYLSMDKDALVYYEGGGGNVMRFAANGKEWTNGQFGLQTIQKTKEGYVLHSAQAKDFFFNDKGRLAHISDRNKNMIDLVYNEGRLAMIKDNFNNQVKLKWGDFGGQARVTLIEMGDKKARYEYSKLGDLVRASGMDGVPYDYAYDDEHNMTKIAYQDGTSKDMSYNKARDWVVKFKDRDGIATSYDYYADKLDPENKFGTNVTRTIPNVAEKDASRFWYEFRRRADGSRYNYRAVTWIRGVVTETIFTECCGTPSVISQWKATDGKGGDAAWTVAATDKKSTYFEYYPDGLLKKKTSADGAITSLAYDPKHKKVSSVVRDGHKVDYNYDERGNLAWAFDGGQNRRMDLTYDLKGRITVIQERAAGNKAAPKMVYFRYNADGRPVEIKEKSGAFEGSIKVAYGNNGEVKSIMNAQGRAVASERELESARRVATTFQNLLEIVQPAGVSLTPEG